MWYEKCYRRHLCDMHIEDWDDIFLRDFSPEHYLENLKRAKVKNAMLYFQSHVGHCYYPTKTGHMHRAFRGKEDSMRKLEQLCHENDIYVTGYYSLIFNTYEHDRHPEWRMITKDGGSGRTNDIDGSVGEFSSAKRSRYGLCCPNNMEYRAFVYAQIEEMLDYFNVDGMFYDMPFWSHICYCDSCRKRWKAETGRELPVHEDMSDPEYRLFMDKRRKWMGEFVAEVTKKTKEYAGKPISVEHNFASAVSANTPILGCAEEVNEGCDYVGGDFYAGILAQSFTCKFYRNITRNEPFEYMFSCTPSLSLHTGIKSYDQMLASVFLTMAHHGASFVIDAMDPVGTMDQRIYEQIGRVFEKLIPFEKYLLGDMVEEVGVYYSMKSLFALHGNEFMNKHCSINTVKSMIRNHIPVGVTGGFHELKKYKAVVAPYLTMEDEYDNSRLIDYVESGGTLYISGGDNEELLKKLLGVEVKEWTRSRFVYMAPKAGVDFGWYNEKYPLAFNAYAPIISGAAEEDVVAVMVFPYTSEQDERYASIHSNPPGIWTNIPAVLKKRAGKGTVIWSALPLENSESYEYHQILLKLLNVEALSFKADADEDTEVILFHNGNELYVNIAELSERYHISANKGFTLQVKCSEPKEIVCLGEEEKPVSFAYDGEYAVFRVDEFRIYAMYRIVL